MNPEQMIKLVDDLREEFDYILLDLSLIHILDIGSAKVTPGEMDGVPHYLIDVLEPRDSFNVVTFQQMAKEALREIYSHGHIPVIAGGTGFYIQALLYDIDFKENEDSSPVRRDLEALAEREGELSLIHI